MPFELELVERLGSVRSRTSAAPARGTAAPSSACSIRLCAACGFYLAGRGAAPSRDRRYSWISLRRGLRPDARNPGHVVDAVAHQREHVADLLRRHAELLDHLGASMRRLFIVSSMSIPASSSISCIRSLSELTIVTFQPARRRAVIAGDDVVGLEPRFLDARQRESAGRVADQRELRHQVLGRRRAVGLVLVVHLVAEAYARDSSRITARCVGPSALWRSSASFHSIVV